MTDVAVNVTEDVSADEASGSSRNDAVDKVADFSTHRIDAPFGKHLDLLNTWMDRRKPFRKQTQVS